MELKIKDKYYDLIRHGIKIYEMRLLDDKLNEFTKNMKRPKYLIFVCNDKKIKCKVSLYDTFDFTEQENELSFNELCSFYPDFKMSDRFVIFRIESVEELEREQ